MLEWMSRFKLTPFAKVEIWNSIDHDYEEGTLYFTPVERSDVMFLTHGNEDVMYMLDGNGVPQLANDHMQVEGKGLPLNHMVLTLQNAFHPQPVAVPKWIRNGFIVHFGRSMMCIPDLFEVMGDVKDWHTTLPLGRRAQYSIENILHMMIKKGLAFKREYPDEFNEFTKNSKAQFKK